MTSTVSKQLQNLNALRQMLINSLPPENLPDNNNGVNNMTDQGVNRENGLNRPGSGNAFGPGVGAAPKALSEAELRRQEKLQLLRDKQNSDRLKKLEELKEHAAAAAKLREEQDCRRRQHFTELSKKDEERRRAAEERRRMLEEERQTALNAKFESKRMTSMTTSMISNSGRSTSERRYAFGSCTPRLIETYDGSLWKSQYNLNSSPAVPGASSSDSNKGGRATSAQDLLSGKKNVMSTSMYNWNQHRTTVDNPLVHRQESRRDDDGSQHNRLFFFCGRRKTDLTPTIPIKRDSFNQPPRSSTASGFNSTVSTRPPSSMSQVPAVMTSSTHSGIVNMRSRPTARKPRPISVHVTGVSSANTTPAATTPTGDKAPLVPPRKLFDSTPKRTPDFVDRLSTPRNRSSSSTPKLPSTAEQEKPSSKATTPTAPPPKPRPASATRAAKKSERPAATSTATTPTATESKPVRVKSSPTPPPVGKSVTKEAKSSEVPTAVSTTTSDTKVEEESISSEAAQTRMEEEATSEVPIAEPSASKSDEALVDVTTTTIETEIVKTSEEPSVKVASAVSTPEPVKEVSPAPEPVVVKPVEIGAEPAPASADQSQTEETFGLPKRILSEEEARAQLAEKRRQAREAQEREAARLEEIRLQEEERLRQEAEEHERVAMEGRRAEEERLQQAIREREQREAEELERKKAEEAARLEKEMADREAAREAERTRLEMEQRLAREELEREERRKRVAAIMSRTRVSNKIAQEQENQQNQENLKNIVQEKQEETPVISSTMNETFNNLQNNSNSFNNNTTSSTLISFDDNEFNHNNSNGVSQPGDQHLVEGFRANAMSASAPSAAATIEDLLS